MLKTEMTQQQLKNRSLFLGKLREAGWKVNKGWELLFEQGHSVTPEAQTEYQNPMFELRLSYCVERDYILWECVGRNNPIVLSLRFYLQEKLDIILDTIVEVQDTVSPDNFTDFVKKMVHLCDTVLIETSERLLEVSLEE